MEPSECLEKKSKKDESFNSEPTATITLQDNYDILLEVLRHLDARSLGTAACVSKLWNNIYTMESLWENLCNCHCTIDTGHAATTAQVQSAVIAMGGYRRLYLLCIRPLMARLESALQCRAGEARAKLCWTKDHVRLSLSLFSVDCYERLGNRLGDCSSLSATTPPPPALQFDASLQPTGTPPQAHRNTGISLLIPSTVF